MRVRLVSCVLVCFLALTGRAVAADPPYYLALGDSLAIGAQPVVAGVLYDPTNQGYADDLHAFYRLRLPGLRLAKLGCSGETTGSMITGVGSPCYDAGRSQLAQAIVFLQTHNVVLVTIDIGATNLLECLNLSAPIDPVCVATAAATAANDLATILGTLRTYAPHVLIVGMNYYDPLLAAYVFGGNGPLLAAASLKATVAFNSALEQIYGVLQVPVADVARTFRIGRFPINVIIALSWTWMGASPPRGPDVHPNAIGYLAIASAFAKAIEAP